MLMELVRLPIRKTVIGKLERRMLIELHDLFDIAEKLVQACGSAVRRNSLHR
jgi:hypothetical protein